MDPATTTQPQPDAATASEAPLLCVEDLSVDFAVRGGILGPSRGAVRAVRNVSLSLRAGESLGLVGESGSGKTTVGRAILRLLDPASVRVTGRVEFAGTDVLAAARGRLRALRRSMQIIFQDSGGSLNPRHRVSGLIAEPIIVHRLARGSASVEARVRRLLDQVGLPASALERFPHEFSGGQRQRIAIARALALEPRLIVCDEPTSALDVSIQAQILNLLSELQERLGLAYLFISHDLAVVRHMCPRIAVMRSGEIIEAGEQDRILRSPSQAYTRALIDAVPSADLGTRPERRSG
jgi:ABC-type microcin C transport system duplicated ATPase subunit YejF